VNPSKAVIARVAMAAVLALLIPFARAEERWKIQYFYDKPEAVFNIRDLACPSAQRCLAVGSIVDGKGRTKGALVSTSDGGHHWTLEDFSEEPVSLFLPNGSKGWMATDRGIWMSEESGRSWKKLEPMKGIAQVYFLDESHGFAVGYPKAIYETTDGGQKWIKRQEAQTPASKADDTIYDCVAFHGNHGAIVGRVMTDKDQRYPVWLVPNAERTRQQKQSEMFLLETADGGKTWKSSSNPIVGSITGLWFLDDQALALVEYHDMYELPSAVLKLKLGAPDARLIFGERDRAVSDLALLPGGGALIASVQPPGNTNQVPIPGKLKMLRSKNLKLWEEMNVDFRAEAQRAIIAAPDAKHAWVATDTGMILALEDNDSKRASE